MNRIMNVSSSVIKRRLLQATLVLTIAGSSVAAFAQYGAPAPNYPPPQYGPNYGPAPQSHYWQDFRESSGPDFAHRWGYHAGEVNGQRDRVTGHSYRPTHDDAYKHVPNSDGIPMPRALFKDEYKDAYIRGYQAGYGH